MEIIVLSWFANTLLPAKLGDVCRGYLFKKATGVSFTRTRVRDDPHERLMDILGLFSFSSSAASRSSETNCRASR